MSDLIADLYRQNEWANLRLLEVCRALPEDLLDATAVGAYGTIRDTLVHYVGGEQRYVRWLRGNLGMEPMQGGDAFPGFDYLEASVRASAVALTALARTAPGTKVDRDPGEVVDAEVILVQAESDMHDPHRSWCHATGTRRMDLGPVRPADRALRGLSPALGVTDRGWR